MIYRTLTENDTEAFFEMMCRLDEETEYMMYEPGNAGKRQKTWTGCGPISKGQTAAGISCWPP